MSAGLEALLAAVLVAGHRVSFGTDPQTGDCFADVLSTTGSQSSGVGDTPLAALRAAAAEYGLYGEEDDTDESLAGRVAEQAARRPDQRAAALARRMSRKSGGAR